MRLIALLGLFLPIFALAQPANNEPCGATTLGVNPSCLFVTFPIAGATFSSAIPSSGCSSSSPTPGDVWFRIVVPANGYLKITFETQTNSLYDDGSIQVFTSPALCTSLTYLTCVDDVNGDLMPRVSLQNLVPGSIVYVRFYQFNGNTNGLFKVCASSPAEPNLNAFTGIGLADPDSTLDVNGNALIRGGMRVMKNIQLSAGSPSLGKVLTSDENGYATWQNVPEELGPTNTGNTLWHNGTSWTPNSSLTTDGVNTTVSGTIKIMGGAPAANTVLTATDNLGSAVWKPAPYKTRFQVTTPSDQLFPSTTTGSKKIGFPTNTSNPGSLFSNSDSTFTAPVAGLYQFKAKLTFSAFTTAAGNVILAFLRSGGPDDRYSIPSMDRETTLEFNAFFSLAANEKVSLRIFNLNSGTTLTLRQGFDASNGTHFSGFLVQPN